MSVTTTVINQNEALEIQRTEIVTEEQKLLVGHSAEQSNPQTVSSPAEEKATPAAEQQIAKKVRWYEGYRAGYFC